MYYFCVSKNGKKIYNFDDPVEFVDVVVEPYLVDDQPIGAPHGVSQDDANMKDVDHEDGQGSRIDVEYGSWSSIITMLQTCRLRKMSAMRRISRGEMLLRQLKWNDFVSFKST